jgi:hypothetical protein
MKWKAQLNTGFDAELVGNSLVVNHPTLWLYSADCCNLAPQLSPAAANSRDVHRSARHGRAFAS